MKTQYFHSILHLDHQIHYFLLILLLCELLITENSNTLISQLLYFLQIHFFDFLVLSSKVIFPYPKCTQVCLNTFSLFYINNLNILEINILEIVCDEVLQEFAQTIFCHDLWFFNTQRYLFFCNIRLSFYLSLISFIFFDLV